MNRIEGLIGTIEDALLAVAHDVASIWVLSQVALILLAAALGTVAATLLRRRIDTRRAHHRLAATAAALDRGCSWPISARSFSCCWWWSRARR